MSYVKREPRRLHENERVVHIVSIERPCGGIEGEKVRNYINSYPSSDYRHKKFYVVNLPHLTEHFLPTINYGLRPGLKVKTLKTMLENAFGLKFWSQVEVAREFKQHIDILRAFIKANHYSLFCLERAPPPSPRPFKYQRISLLYQSPPSYPIAFNNSGSGLNFPVPEPPIPPPPTVPLFPDGNPFQVQPLFHTVQSSFSNLIPSNSFSDMMAQCYDAIAPELCYSPIDSEMSIDLEGFPEPPYHCFKGNEPTFSQVSALLPSAGVGPYDRIANTASAPWDEVFHDLPNFTTEVASAPMFAAQDVATINAVNVPMPTIPFSAY